MFCWRREQYVGQYYQMEKIQLLKHADKSFATSGTAEDTC